jgi:hypothetical protein
MPAGSRSVTARLVDVTPVEEEGRAGAWLGFHPEGSRLGVGRIDDFADLGPELTVPAVFGLGKVLRLLRAARLAAPEDPLGLVGRPLVAAERLRRALGTAVRLELRPRTSLRFVAWTEQGVETLHDVEDVLEDEKIVVVRRGRGHPPACFDRGTLVRRHTERERWYEILDIERA